PCWVTSQRGPIFSVISMRPSGRKAIRQGSSKLATVVILKGRVASGFVSPALTWPQAATAARVNSNPAFANFIIISLCFPSARSSAIRGADVYRTLPSGAKSGRAPKLGCAEAFAFATLNPLTRNREDYAYIHQVCSAAGHSNVGLCAVDQPSHAGNASNP